jgi:allophanate hydrolase
MAALTRAYRSGSSTPSQEVDRVLQRIADRGDDGTWITVVDRIQLLQRARELESHPDPTSLPLYGVPFGVKDSIDVRGVPTTLACPDYAYVADRTAPSVARLLRAGAIFVGKTNLDQFATGLNGTRTPYTVPRSVYGGDLISGGSSSGSALAVAAGSVPFTVATDTAGSGRVPPALNGVVGFKPSRGLISTVGLVPACRSLDCISVIAGDITGAAHVFDVIAGVDRRDPHSRQRRREAVSAADLRVGLPDAAQLEFFDDTAMRDAHLGARAVIAERFARVVEAPFAPFLAAGELLYQGPWVAERLAEFGPFLRDHADGVLPVIRTILEGGARYSAVDVFAAEHRLGELKVQVAALWARMDVLVLPAVGTTFTVEEVLADPIGTNTALGHYTHFGNLLDLCAAVVPAGMTTDGRPAALMVLGPALADDRVLTMAAALSGAPHSAAGADPKDEVPSTSTAVPGGAISSTSEAPSPGSAPSAAAVTIGPVTESLSAAMDTESTTRCTLVVVGHHLSGEPRNGDLLDRGGVLTATTRTAARYRLVRIGDDAPVPALVAVPRGGAAIDVETWSVPAEACVAILAASSGSVCLGRVELADGTTQIGFVGDAAAMATDAITDITEFGGWRNYLAAGSPVG